MIKFTFQKNLSECIFTANKRTNISREVFEQDLAHSIKQPLTCLSQFFYRIRNGALCAEIQRSKAAKVRIAGWFQ